MAFLSRSVTATVVNDSERALAVVLSKSAIEWGSYDTPEPTQIPAGASFTWTTSTDGFMSGTEGKVHFAVDGGEGFFEVYWDNPFIGDNQFTQSAGGVASYVALSPTGADPATGEPLDEDRMKGDDDVAVTYRFSTKAYGSASAGSVDPLAYPPSNQDPKATQVPAGQAVLVRDADATYRKIVYLGLNSPQADSEAAALRKHVPASDTGNRTEFLTARPASTFADEERRFNALSERTAEAWVASLGTTMPDAQRGDVVTLMREVLPRRAWHFCALVRVLAHVEEELRQLSAKPDPAGNEHPPMKRLIISGHHAPYEPGGVGTIFGDAGFSLAVTDLEALSGYFPDAMAQVEDIFLAACNTGHGPTSTPPKNGYAILPPFPKIFANVQTVWAYEATAPSALGACVELAKWEQTSRRAASRDELHALAKYQRNSAPSFDFSGKPVKGIAMSILWAREGDALSPLPTR